MCIEDREVSMKQYGREVRMKQYGGERDAR
jgi:hypothetical protein